MKKNSESFTFLSLVLQSFTSLPNITVLDLKKWATKKLFSLFFFACKEWFSPRQFKNCKRYEKFSECLFIMKRKLIRCYHTWQSEAVARSCFVKKAETCNFIEKETLAKVFSCQFCEISKNTFSYRTPPVAASGQYLEYILKRIFIGKNRSSYSFKKLFIIFSNVSK